VVAVCGKGGVGKTAVSALLGHALMERGVRPLLLVDADPVGGLGFAVGSPPPRTLADVRAHVLEAARGSDEAARRRLADELDYRLLEVLAEHEEHALLAMGRSGEAGCFCPVNRLLRHAVDGLAAGFAAVLVDAEAGVEQIQREVTRQVDLLLVVVDGSQRSLHTLEVIRELAASTPVAVLANRVSSSSDAPQALPPGAALLGRVPEDPVLADFDRAGRSLWELPESSAARRAARRTADALGERLAPRRSFRSDEAGRDEERRDPNVDGPPSRDQELG